ncbi:MAG: hypothetical protein K0U37_09680 [Gammaproteobacteria bacterium]|nr:hypothetical protein [Gammaproteobacteria bacterium]
MNKNIPHQKDRSFKQFDDEDSDVTDHKREVKRMLEDKLERKRLKNELEDFDGELEGEFDWDEFDLDR